MKKTLISMLIMVLFLLSIPVVAFGATTNEILEVPDVKIIMEGTLTEYKDVPICIGQRTLLPLREMLVNLGVPNDGEHIIYNNIDKSVTVIKDQTRIYLVSGNKTAYVNEQPIELDTAPTGYDKNQRIYIPLRFVAEALNKKVVWDGSANTILICDLEKYENIKEILGRSEEAMMLVEKCKQTIDVDSSIKSGEITMKLDVQADAQIDKVQKKMYLKMLLNMLGMEMKADTYYADNTSYVLDTSTQKWQKKTYLPPEYDKLLASQSDTAMLKVSESLCAGLTQIEGTNPGEILLKGDVYLPELFKKALATQEAGETLVSEKDMDFDTFHIEISLNSSTNLINSIIINVGLTQTTDKQETVKADVSASILYSEYNGDFQIVIPEDILLNTVEMNSDATPVSIE